MSDRWFVPPALAAARHTVSASISGRTPGGRELFARVSPLLAISILFIIALALTRSFEPRID